LFLAIAPFCGKTKNTINYNIKRGSRISWFSCWCSILDELEFGDVVFLEEEKVENPAPQSKARTNNKLNPHVIPGRNRTGGRRALSPLPHFLFKSQPLYFRTNRSQNQDSNRNDTKSDDPS